MELGQYLQQKYTSQTVDRYLRDIGFYTAYGNQAFNKPIEQASYQDIMEFIGQLRKQYSNPQTIHRILQGVKKYYNWLQHTGQRKDHPCKSIRLKDSSTKGLQPQDLFSEKELEMLLNSKPGHRHTDRKQDPPGGRAGKTRNKLILTFMVYQGMTRTEISHLEIKDINLEKGEIHIRPTKILNGRTLPLKASQVHLLYEYLYKSRPKSDTLKLLIGQRNAPLTQDAITRIIMLYQYLFTPEGAQVPDRKLTATTIRMSVCANLLKTGKDLRVVQVYMGHKYPSSTERYKQNRTEELKKAIKKYHPLQ